MPSRARRFTLAALLCSVFTAALEATVVATAMPSVVADLGGIELYGWVGAVYLLTSTVTMPVFGKLADQRGRKPVLLAAIVLFLLGTAASGAAQSMLTLILARALQGVGAGGIQPIALTVVGDLYPPDRRAKIQGMFGSVWALAGVSGPLLGGFLVTAASWRWTFYVNVPVGIVAALWIATFYTERVERKPHRFDVLGVATLSLGVVCLLLGVGGTFPWFTLPLSLLLLVGFVLAERRAPEPLVPLALMRERLFATSNGMSLLLGAVMMGTLLYLPLHAQAVLGHTPTEAGTVITPMMLGWPMATAVSGRLLKRHGYRAVVRGGGALVLLSALLLLLPLGSASAMWCLRLNQLVLGFGLGFANTAAVIAVQDSVEWQQRGAATAATLFARTIGGALSAGALGALLANALLGSVPPGAVDELLRTSADGGHAVAAPELAEPLQMGMRAVFHAIVGLSVLAWLSSLAFPQHRSRLPRHP